VLPVAARRWVLTDNIFVVELLPHVQPFYGLELPFEAWWVCNTSTLGYQHLEELVLVPKYEHVLSAPFLHKQQQMHHLLEFFFLQLWIFFNDCLKFFLHKCNMTVYTQKRILEYAIFFTERLTIIGSACLDGTPFFCVCVLI
jgi:hypothetical protein